MRSLLDNRSCHLLHAYITQSIILRPFTHYLIESIQQPYEIGTIISSGPSHLLSLAQITVTVF